MGEQLAVDKEGNEYLLYQERIDICPGWDICYLYNRMYIARGVIDPFVKNAGFFILCICLFMGLLVLFLYKVGHRDILQQEKREDSLRESEERLRSFTNAIANNALDAIILIDDQRKIVYWNPAAEGIFGYSRNDVIEREIDILSFSEEDMDVYDLLESDGYGRMLETKGTGKDGTQFPIEASCSKIMIKDKRYCAWIIRDISERKKAEDALATEKERLFVTLHSISDGVIAADTEGKILFMNKEAAGLTEWTKKEAVGRQVSEVFHIIHEKTGKICTDPVERVLHTGNPVFVEDHTLLVTKNGKERVLGYSAAPIQNRGKMIIGVILVFRDITEKIKVQRDLQNIEKLESIGMLAGGIAHDFNNILTVIIGNVSLAKVFTEQGDERFSILISVEKAAHKAKYLANKLLTFSKGGVPRKEAASIAELIKNTTLSGTSGAKLRCDISLPEDLWSVEFDKRQMAQVLNSLIQNAQEAMPEGGKIWINARNVLLDTKESQPLPEGRYVEIVVKDEGPGIAEENISKVFDPFFTTKQMGSGMGLSIVYSIIKQHNGHITVKSESGSGAQFSIFLPASQIVSAGKPHCAAQAESREK